MTSSLPPVTECFDCGSASSVPLCCRCYNERVRRILTAQERVYKEIENESDKVD